MIIPPAVLYKEVNSAHDKTHWNLEIWHYAETVCQQYLILKTKYIVMREYQTHKIYVLQIQLFFQELEDQ